MRGQWSHKHYWEQCDEDKDCTGMNTCCAKIGLYLGKQEKWAMRCMKSHVVKGGVKVSLGGKYQSWSRCAFKKKQKKSRSRWFKAGSLLKSLRKTRSSANFLSLSVA